MRAGHDRRRIRGLSLSAPMKASKAILLLVLVGAALGVYFGGLGEYLSLQKLQSLLGDALPGVGRARVLADMDAWGYTFRLGSARAYVEQDAAAAWAWLQAHGLVDEQRRLRFPDAG